MERSSSPTCGSGAGAGIGVGGMGDAVGMAAAACASSVANSLPPVVANAGTATGSASTASRPFGIHGHRHLHAIGRLPRGQDDGVRSLFVAHEAQGLTHVGGVVCFYLHSLSTYSRNQSHPAVIRNLVPCQHLQARHGGAHEARQCGPQCWRHQQHGRFARISWRLVVSDSRCCSRSASPGSMPGPPPLTALSEPCSSCSRSFSRVMTGSSSLRPAKVLHDLATQRHAHMCLPAAPDPACAPRVQPAFR